MPSGFWSQYQSKYLKKNLYDQGTFGGILSMYWFSKVNKTFNSSAIIKYAERNGWQLCDSLEISSKDLKSYHNEVPSFYKL